MDVVVARIGKAHGLRGEVTVEVRTDAPQERFVPGARFPTDPARPGPLTSWQTLARHNDILLLGFDAARDRNRGRGPARRAAARRHATRRRTTRTPGTSTSWSASSVVTVDGEPSVRSWRLDPLPAQDLLVVG